MLIKIKLVLIALTYLLGAMFMLMFPPRNFIMSSGKIRTTRSVPNDPVYSSYLNSAEVLKIASALVKDAPEIARLVTLKPKTYNDNSIIAMELQSDKNSKKPGLLIIGAIDPMVWSAPVVLLELANRLLYDTKYQTPFFNDYDWYLIPMSNPDAIDLTMNLRDKPAISSNVWSKNITTRTEYRPSEWHKNVELEDGKTCFGTHINRNFPYHWQDDVNKSPDHCSQYYPGPKPFSSLEAKAIRAYVDERADLIHMAIHLHANFVPKKELILYPWRYSTRQHSNYLTLQAIGEYAARHSRLPGGRLFEVHQSSMENRVAGSLSDYISGVAGTELVYILRPYHQIYPNFSDPKPRDLYTSKAISVILSLLRGWRSNTKQNTLWFFGNEVDF